jgi:hypothetical protein
MKWQIALCSSCGRSPRYASHTRRISYDVRAAAEQLPDSDRENISDLGSLNERDLMEEDDAALAGVANG